MEQGFLILKNNILWFEKFCNFHQKTSIFSLIYIKNEEFQDFSKTFVMKWWKFTPKKSLMCYQTSFFLHKIEGIWKTKTLFLIYLCFFLVIFPPWYPCPIKTHYVSHKKRKEKMPIL